MYNEIIIGALRGIQSPTAEMEIIGIVNQALTDAGYSHIHILGIFNGGESLFEGVVMNGETVETMNDGPLTRFTYDWDTDEFNAL
jgi:hypothetical protein